MFEGVCLEWGGCGAVVGWLVALGLAGVVYAVVLEWAEERWGVVSDLTWLSVVVGVGMVLGFMAVVWWEAAVVALLCFGVAGVPIVVRSLVNGQRRRGEVRRRLQGGERDGDEG